MNKDINCKICDKPLKNKQTHYCCTICKNKAHQSYSAQKERGFQRKLQIIQSFGGKCSQCGYKKNMAALTFHHLDPKQKQFKLDVRSLSNRKYECIENELSKCILLCHNCHAEIHNPQHNLENYL